MRLIAFVCLIVATASRAQAPHPIQLASLDNPAQFEFLTPLLDGVEVVSLGESIHLTREFPLVRLGMIRHLHEQLGFDIVAMEGSAEDLWVAQDRLLASARGRADCEQSQTGLFPIWNTAEVTELIEYEVASWASPRPLYITAYDIQPGSGMAPRGPEVFRLLADRLSAYAPAPVGFDLDAWLADLTPITRSCSPFQPSDGARVEAAIVALEPWIEQAALAVEQQYPNLPHAAVLRLIPANLRASLRLCSDLGGADWSRYKAARDTHAAEYTLQLKSIAPSGKLILWAHLSHVFHDDGHVSTSVGGILHRMLGSRLYTIIPFAESGMTVLLFSDVNSDIAYARVHWAEAPLGQHLRSLSSGDYFLDVRTQTDPLFTTPQAIWVEAGTSRLTLGRDMDAIIWIKTVHAPHLLDKRMSLLFLALSVAHYRVPVLVGAAVLVVAGICLIVIRRRRRRMR